jgi:hypothetical protein
VGKVRCCGADSYRSGVVGGVVAVTDQMVRVRDILDIVYNYSSAPDSYYYAGQLQRISGWAGAAVKIREAIEQYARDLADADVTFDDVEVDDAP